MLFTERPKLKIEREKTETKKGAESEIERPQSIRESNKRNE